MVAESGGRLLEPDAERSLRERLVQRASVVTPNVMEAAALAELASDADAEELARAVHALGPAAVVVTGGHREAGGDLFYDGERLVEIPGERHPDGAAHGSGCTHSSVLAAQLALGLDPLEAARRAQALASAAVAAGLRGIGRGPGPVDVLGGAGARADAPVSGGPSDR
jgi:hydroxymethylpyrimidine/phosphomethylpyrimidine kinase